MQKGYLCRPCRACSGRSMQWTQYTIDTVRSMQYAVHSGIVVYGGGDIVFGAKRSNQRMQ